MNRKEYKFPPHEDTPRFIFFFHDFALICLLPQVSRDSPNETNRLRRERDELQSLVEKFEKHLTEVSGFCI